MTTERFCPACGLDLPDNAAFCSGCGTRQSEDGPEPEALIGRIVDGRFRVLRLLGTGGMGAVYLAEHAGIGRRVAIKVLRTELRDQPDLVRRFHREITTVSRLTDAHTVTVFDSGMWHGLAYLVMEYLRGIDLATTLNAEGRLGVERALRIASQVGSSLAEAHQQGVVHRDLKPENIFLTRSAAGEELVKVLDFGLAKLMSAESGPEGTFQTQKGILLGTPWYMAPEQIEGGEVGPPADLYALGALIYRMLAGRPAFTGNTPIQVLESHLRPERPVLEGPDIPRPVADLVGRLLARSPADRPRSVQDVLETIHEFLPGERTPEWALVTAPHERPPGFEFPVRAPSGFSTSAAEGPTPAPAPPRAAATPPPEGPDLHPPSSPGEDLAQLQRTLGLGWRARLVGVVAALSLIAGLAWWLLRPAGPPTTEVEPNDDLHTASPIAPGTAVQGYLGRRLRPEHSDLDHYRLVAPGVAGPVRVRLTGVPGIDLVVDGFDRDGQRIARLNGAGAGLGEVGELPAVTWVLVRELWVAGVPPQENSTDAYTLEITPVSAQSAP